MVEDEQEDCGHCVEHQDKIMNERCAEMVEYWAQKITNDEARMSMVASSSVMTLTLMLVKQRTNKYAFTLKEYNEIRRRFADFLDLVALIHRKHAKQLAEQVEAACAFGLSECNCDECMNTERDSSKPCSNCKEGDALAYAEDWLKR